MTNLSEDTRESDLQELFRPFGPISRIFLAKDKQTNQSKVINFTLHRLNLLYLKYLNHYNEQTDSGHVLIFASFLYTVPGVQQLCSLVHTFVFTGCQELLLLKKALC